MIMTGALLNVFTSGRGAYDPEGGDSVIDG